MSLILDALKKLEREKQAGPPGVVVVGHVPWGGGGRRLVPLVAAAVLTMVAAGGAFWALGRPPAASPSTPGARTGDTPPAREGSPVAPVGSPVPPRMANGPAGVAADAAIAVPPSPRRLELPVAAAKEGAEASAAPVSAPTPGVEEFHLNAISIRDGAPIALLNDRLVREGDSFDGVRVIRIGEAEVEIEIRGRRRIIRF